MREATDGEILGSFLGQASEIERGPGVGKVTGVPVSRFEPYESRATDHGRLVAVVEAVAVLLSTQSELISRLNNRIEKLETLVKENQATCEKDALYCARHTHEARSSFPLSDDERDRESPLYPEVPDA